MKIQQPSPAPSASGTRLIVGLLVVILVAAGGLRLLRLDRVPPGAWIDEAIQGLQGASLIEHTPLPPTSHVGYQPMPEWIVPEVIAMRLGGHGLGTLRMPAALVGVVAVAVAFLAGRALAGPAAGLGAAAFLMGSFWHVQYSRLALPCVFVVTEGLLVGWLLLGRRAPGLGAGCALAFLCLVAPYGYAASLITPVGVALLLAIRWRGAPADRPGRGFILVLAAGVVLLAAGMVWWKPQGLLRTAELAGEHRDPLVGQFFGWLKSVVWSTQLGDYYWRHYPPGAPRFTPVELALVVGGAVALWRSASFARWQKWGWTGWAVACALPEWFGGEVPHLSRGLPQLAPAAVAAGVGVGALARWLPPWGPAVALAALTANAALTTDRLYGRFARDPIVATWYLKPNRDAAEAILAAAAKEPVALTGSVDYAKDPVLLYFLWPALRRGDVVMTENRPRYLYCIGVYRDPTSKQPAFVLFDAHKPWKGRRNLSLWFVNYLLSGPEGELAAGNLQEALLEYQWIVTFIPDSVGARAGLGVTLVRLGRGREAIPHLEYALSCNQDPNAKKVIESALLLARHGLPGVLR